MGAELPVSRLCGFADRSDQNNTVVAYCTDQCEPSHGQMLSHQVSSDLVNWGPVVNDVAYGL